VQTSINELKEISLSLPTVVGAKGVLEVLLPKMSTIERENLMYSARILSAANEQLKELF
jgi:malate/lactate dehydrogenase